MQQQNGLSIIFYPTFPSTTRRLHILTWPTQYETKVHNRDNIINTKNLDYSLPSSSRRQQQPQEVGEEEETDCLQQEENTEQQHQQVIPNGDEIHEERSNSERELLLYLYIPACRKYPGSTHDRPVLGV